MTMAVTKRRAHSTVPAAARHQVFTPRDIADWMTAWACAGHPATILEPGAGRGVFLDAIEALWQTRKGDRPAVTAFETDATLCAELLRRCDAGHVNVRHADFITAGRVARFDACVANPPYVRHHELRYPERFYTAFDRQIGARLSRMTNLYGLFLLRIWSSLSHGGRAAVITPAEWLNADFGCALKRYLLSENALDGLVHFAPSALAFPDALTTAVIVLLRRGRATDEAIRAAHVADCGALQRLQLVDASAIHRKALDPAKKWSRLFETSRPARGRALSRHTLGAFAECTRGIATGANAFFTLSESERRAHGIDLHDVAPCVAKAGHVSDVLFDDGALQRLIASPRKVWLLRPRMPLRAAVVKYLAIGRRLGIDRRYLPAHRP